MKSFLLVVPALALGVAGCANRANERAAVRGALIGAAGGAVLSAATGGDALQGAAIGAAGGAAVGVITEGGRQRKVYRRREGGRYWVDERGRQHDLSDRR